MLADGVPGAVRGLVTRRASEKAAPGESGHGLDLLMWRACPLRTFALCLPWCAGNQPAVIS
jgi:hypothetical protein